MKPAEPQLAPLNTPHIKLTISGLADFMSATETRRRKILKDHKYPNQDEPRAKILYYRQSSARILRYHQNGLDSRWLESEAKDLLSQINVGTPSSRKTRLESNARCLTSYARSYDSQSITSLSNFRQSLVFKGVRISIAPEIFALHKDKETLIKLNFSKTPFTPLHTQLCCYLLHKASLEAGHPIPISRCFVGDIESKTDSKKSGKGTRIMSDIEAACLNIEAIWESL